MQNEIFEIMAQKVLTKILNLNKYYSILVVQSADVLYMEQVSIMSLGFKETANTTAETLIVIIKDAV